MSFRPLRGMVIAIDLDPVIGHEQGRKRPCVVVQNDVSNRFSSTVIVVPLTDLKHIKIESPAYVLLRKGDGGIGKDSCVLCDQIRVVDMQRCSKIYGTLSAEAMDAIDMALTIVLGLRKKPSPFRTL